MMGAAHSRLNPALRCPRTSTTPATLKDFGELLVAEQLNLSRLKYLNPRPGTRLNKSPDTDTFIFQRLRLQAGRRQTGKRPPWNNHSKVPCPVSPKIQIGSSPCLSNGQNLALDQRKAPDPSQNTARTFGVFYGRGVCPDAYFSLARSSLGGEQRGPAFPVAHVRRNQCLASRQKLPLHQHFVGQSPRKRGLPAVTIGRVVIASEPDVTSRKQRGQRPHRLSAGLLGQRRFDPGQAYLARVLQAKASDIDHFYHAPFALRFERARGSPMPNRRLQPCSRSRWRRMRPAIETCLTRSRDARCRAHITDSFHTTESTHWPNLPLHHACGMIAIMAIAAVPQCVRGIGRFPCGGFFPVFLA